MNLWGERVNYLHIKNITQTLTHIPTYKKNGRNIESELTGFLSIKKIPKKKNDSKQQKKYCDRPHIYGANI